MGYEHVFVSSLAGVHVHLGPSGGERRGGGGREEGEEEGEWDMNMCLCLAWLVCMCIQAPQVERGGGGEGGKRGKRRGSGI